MENPGLFPALTQGKKFTKYQNNIAMNLGVKEGFQSETKDILQRNHQNQSSMRELYDNTLKQYESLMNTISGSTTNYLDRISTNNPYLNKIIQFSTGENAYVTNQGVVKLIPDKTIWQSIPAIASMKPVSLALPWIASYNTPGTQIPTNPPLVSGTNVTANQSLEHAGANVFVNSFLPTNTKPSYKGCYKHNDSLTFIGNAPPVVTEPVSILNGNFSQPSLTPNSYKYYTSSTDIPNWTFNNAVILNNSVEWGYPMPYPNGNQCVSIQNLAYIYQTLQLIVGSTYTLTFWACGRNCCTGSKTNPLIVQIATVNAGNVVPEFACTPPIDQWTKYTYTFTVPTSNVYMLKFKGTIMPLNKDQSSAIQNISIQTSTDQTTGQYTFEQCQQAATEEGYPYFALQDVNSSTSKGYCVVSKSLPAFTQNGSSTVSTKQKVVWSSNTEGQPGNVASLTATGSLQVINSSGKAMYSTPSETSTPSNYVGCYTDQSSRAISTFANNGAQQYNLQQCQQLAQEGKYTVFGLQNSTSGTNAQCLLGNSLEEAMKYGKATNCTQLADGSWCGGGWSNAVYNTSSSISNYTLELGDTYLQISRGTNPLSDNQGNIWGTNFMKGEKNSNYAASKGKFGQNWISSGDTMAAGDWVGSPNGYAALIMQSNGNLVLLTFETASSCEKMVDGNVGGGMGANAVYNINQNATPSNIGKLAFIDANADLHAYPDDTSNIAYLNQYTLMKGISNPDADIPGASFANSTVEKCKTACNENPDCAGFVTNAAGDYCWPQSNRMYPFNNKGILNLDRNTYLRDRVPASPPLGVPQTTFNIDSATYGNYPDGGSIYANKYGLTKATTAQQQELSALQKKLNDLADQLSQQTDKVENGLVEAQMQSEKNVKGFNKYLHGLRAADIQVNTMSSRNDMQYIVSESDIVALQKNYDYMFWSILAAGTVLVAMNI